MLFFFPAAYKDHLTIMIDPPRVHLLLTCNQKYSKRRLTIKAHEICVLEGTYIYQSLIVGLWHIIDCIGTFITKNNIKNAYVVWMITSPLVKEHYITMPTSTITEVDIHTRTSSAGHFVYSYLYPVNDGHHFYAAACLPWLCLQCQLISIAVRVEMHALVTRTLGCFDLYRAVHYDNFFYSKLYADHDRVKDPTLLVPFSLLDHLVDNADIGDNAFVASACGVLLAQEEVR
jgi:hypothetical protein